MSTQAYYDEYWTESGFLPEGKHLPPVIERLEPLVTKETDVLDVGCGDGRTLGTWIAPRAKSYIGVDISKPAIALAKEAGLDARLIEDAGELGLPDQSVDVVTCVEVLEHLFSPQLAVREIRRVLRPGGVVLFSVPNAAYWRRRADMALLGRWNPLGDDLSIEQPWRDPHIRFYTTTNLAQLLRSEGYSEVAVHGYGGTVTGDIPGVRNRVRRFGWANLAWTSHPVYGRLERRFPGLLGYRLLAIARR